MSEPVDVPPVRVMVVDDQQVMREGLVALLGLLDGVTVVADAGDGAAALALLPGAAPDVVLMDLRMPGMDGVTATGRITEEHPDVAVLVLTTYDDDASIAAALHAGARGYLTKEAGRAEIGAALRAAAAGQATFAPSVSRRLIAALPRPDALAAREQRGRDLPDALTPREAEVLGLIAEGLRNAEIAEALFIGETTVKTHINNAFAKIGARNRTEASRYAQANGLARPS
ncbi:MAG TPA: response regulator transcription factor [Streptosporangiaceae bacterium]|jgi:DNA-binding NarL/FixJ family response regulator